MKNIALCFALLSLCVFAHAQLDCPPLPSRPTPTNVNDLHPNDIKVVVALGDSITAGFGMMGWAGLANEYRGQSWSIGADLNATTMYNFVKHYNPNLIGGSLGHHVVEICIDPDCPNWQYEPKLDVLNAAQSGAMVADLYPHELTYLLDEMQSNPNIDMENDWKLMTILIGSNDLCSSCLEKNPEGEPDAFFTGLVNVLEEVRTNIPRLFVNLVNMFNMSGVYELSLQSQYCVDFHDDFGGECPCIFENGANGTAARTLTDQLTYGVNQKMVEIAQMYQAKNYSDFTVVVQPFGFGTDVATLPLDFISTLDCFHPSLFAHEAMGIALWNNMINPAATKQNYINTDDKPLCPTADTLLYTY